MERVSVLLLLLCSPLGAEHQDNDDDKASPEIVNVAEQPQPCLHAVLRDMSAKLAVLQSKMEQVQILNQEQEAKLKLLQSQVDTQQQEHAAKLTEFENKVDTQQKVGQVAFSASLLASGSGYTGPFNTHTPLVFKHVVSNIGNAYSPNTGLFIAPVRGAYHFEFYIAGGGSTPAAVALVKNGEHVFIAQENPSSFGTAANGATLLLEAVDVVLLRLWRTYRIYDDGNHHSTFSGHLLFPM